MKIEIPSIDVFIKDAEVVTKDIHTHMQRYDSTYQDNEIIKLCIARGLMIAYGNGGAAAMDAILHDIETKIQLARSQPMTKA